MKKLPRSFFDRPTLNVAEELLGKILVFKDKKGIITETEAYFGFDDPASHAARGKTPRSEIMFGRPGFSYVYLIYGMYHCLNVVTEKEEFPAAVLIRGIKVLEEKEENFPKCDGPGKLCKYLGINKSQNAVDMITSSELYILNHQKYTLSPLPFIRTSRIGIKQGQDKLWRFVVKPGITVD